MFELGKLSLIIITRCNLHCKLCCEYVPQNKPFPDMTVEEAERILAAAFDVIDHVNTLHLTGGGEPFLHRQYAKLVEAAMRYSNRFDRLMLFTNTTVPISEELLETMRRYRDRILVQTSRYGINPEREQKILDTLQNAEINCKIVKYYGDEQDFGGWVDFGPWDAQGAAPEKLTQRFAGCAVTKAMHGNWRTRDGKVHWCSRSQRGMELGLIPGRPEEYVDLFDETSREEKQEKFRRIAGCRYLSACDRCSGDQGTEDVSLRIKAAEQG